MLLLLLAFAPLALCRRHRSRHRYSDRYNDDAEDWAQLKKKLKLMARVRASKYADKLRAKKMNNVLMNSILYKFGMTGPLDVADPVSLAFIRSHSKKGEERLDKGLL